MKILRQVVHFGKAYAVWLKAGRPVRSDHLIHHIFTTYCAPCVHYDPELKECSVCECPVSAERGNGRNKLEYATEQCPLPEPRFTRDFTGEIGESVAGSPDGSDEIQQQHRGDRPKSPDDCDEV